MSSIAAATIKVVLLKQVLNLPNILKYVVPVEKLTA